MTQTTRKATSVLCGLRASRNIATYMGVGERGKGEMGKGYKFTDHLEVKRWGEGCLVLAQGKGPSTVTSLPTTLNVPNQTSTNLDIRSSCHLHTYTKPHGHWRYVPVQISRCSWLNFFAMLLSQFCSQRQG